MKLFIYNFYCLVVNFLYYIGIVDYATWSNILAVMFL